MNETNEPLSPDKLRKRLASIEGWRGARRVERERERERDKKKEELDKVVAGAAGVAPRDTRHSDFRNVSQLPGRL